MGKNPQSSKRQKSSAKKIDPAITIAIIGLIGTVLTAIFASPVIIAWIQKPPSPTATPIDTTISATPTLLTNLENQDWNSILRLSIQNNQCSGPRVLPTSISPANDISLAANQIAEASKNETLLNWPLAPLGTDKSGKIIFEVSSFGDNDEYIYVGNKLNMDVVAQKNLPGHFDLVKSFCGGVKEILIFNEINLSTDYYEYKLNSTHANTNSYITLAPGEFEVLSLPLNCKTPGAYILTTNLSFKYIQTEYTTDTHQIFIFICPISFTIWDINQQYPQLTSSTSYLWNGTDYEVMP